jgi:hypothetical protein
MAQKRPPSDQLTLFQRIRQGTEEYHWFSISAILPMKNASQMPSEVISADIQKSKIFLGGEHAPRPPYVGWCIAKNYVSQNLIIIYLLY